MTTTVAADLSALLKLDPKTGESVSDFAKRLALKANNLKEDEWETLEEASQDWVNSALEAIEQKHPVPIPEGLEAVDDEGEDPEGAAPAPEPKATKAKKKGKGAEPEKVRSKRFNSSDKITILAKENPYRAGTQSAIWFGHYKNGMTVKDATEAGTPRHHIRWDLTRGNIKITP